MRSKSVFIDHREGSEAVEANVTAKYCQQGHPSCQWCITAERRLFDFQPPWCVGRVDKKYNLSLSKQIELKVRHSEWHWVARCCLYKKVFLHGGKTKGILVLLEKVLIYYRHYFLLIFLGTCKRETRHVIQEIIFYSIIYSEAHSIKMAIIKKQGTQYEKQLSVRAL